MNYLIIILIIVIILIISNNNKKKESFKNINQFIPDDRITLIRDYFNKITPKQQIFLQNQCSIKEYTRFDIDPSMEKFIKNLIEPYIYSLNQKMNYNYIIINISNILEEIDGKNKNKRYIIDFFIYENINYFVSRVIIDLVLFADNNKYLNKIVLSNANIQKDKIYTKGIYGVDNNTIIKKENVSKNSGYLYGIETSSLKYSNVYSNSNSKSNTSKECLRSEFRNKWILPKDLPEEFSFPFKKETKCWDKYGVLYSCDNNPKCIGKNTSEISKPLYPYYNPTITGIPINDNHLDLMKLTRGLIKPLWN